MSRLRTGLAAMRARTAPALPDPSIEGSEHFGGVAVSRRHQPPRSGAATRHYHGRDHERDRRRVAAEPVLAGTGGSTTGRRGAPCLTGAGTTVRSEIQRLLSERPVG